MQTWFFLAPAKVQGIDEVDGDDAEEDEDGDDEDDNVDKPFVEDEYDDGDGEADDLILTWICENQHKSKEVHYSHLCQTRKPSSRNYIYVFLKCKLF